MKRAERDKRLTRDGVADVVARCTLYITLRLCAVNALRRPRRAHARSSYKRVPVCRQTNARACLRDSVQRAAV